MKISRYNSSKILILNSALIMMVLYIHSYYHEAAQYSCALAVQRFFGGNAFCGVANNLFFLLSGLLFFNGVGKISDCFPKIKKRIRSLLVPYLIWNVIFVLWYILLKFTPGVASFVNSDILSEFDTFWNGVSFLWIEPASFPLWFLRDLICLVALSPLIYLYVRYLKIGGVILIAIASAFNPYLNFYFILGATIAMHYDLECFERYLTKPIIALVGILFLGGCVYVSLQPIDFALPRGAQFLLNLFGVMFVWRIYDIIANNRSLPEKSMWAGLMGYSFFIYLFHEPAFNIIKKVPLRLLGDSELVLIILFLINPIIMALVAICVAKCLRRICPKIYSILVGGR